LLNLPGFKDNARIVEFLGLSIVNNTISSINWKFGEIWQILRDGSCCDLGWYPCYSGIHTAIASCHMFDSIFRYL
jgi:hypothetical protein